MMIGEIERNETEVLRIGVEEYKGRKYIDMRIYFENNEGEWKPTKKGVTVAPEKLPEFIELLQKAGKEL